MDEKLSEIQKVLAEGKEVTGFLSVLLANNKLSLEETYGNLSELMAAGVDTVSTKNTAKMTFISKFSCEICVLVTNCSKVWNTIYLCQDKLPLHLSNNLWESKYALMNYTLILKDE